MPTKARGPEMKEAVRQILTITGATLLPAAEARQYTSWDADFAQQNADRALRRVAGIRVDFSELTDAEAECLGFPLWSEETGIRLIPLWLYPHIAPGQTLKSINGTEVVVTEQYTEQGSEGYIGNDHRGGATAYGFVPTPGCHVGGLIMRSATSFQIIEAHRGGTQQPMDGETFHTKDDLFRALPYADHDAMVIATDFDELRRDGRTTSTDVTEDVTVECWGRLNRTEREEFAERGLFDLASRFVSDEYAAATSATEAA